MVVGQSAAALVVDPATTMVVVVVAGHVQAACVPAGRHAPGHAASPPAAEESQVSAPSASRKPSPQVESAPVNDFAGVFFALIVACSELHAGDGSFPLSRTFVKLPHRAQRAMTVVNFFVP